MNNPPVLVFFKWRFPEERLAPFVLANKRLTQKMLAPFFRVVVEEGDCDLAEVCDRHQPDILLFESGSGTLPFQRPRIANVRANPEVPRIGILESDPHSGSRSVFIADMERWGVETFFSRMTPMPEYFTEIADRLYLAPWHADTEVFRDWGLEKTTDVALTGGCSHVYPWREKIFPLLAERFLTTRVVHGGYSKEWAGHMPWGRDYSRLLNTARFSASCGTAWKIMVKKHLEIPASRCCLVAEDTASLAAAGFRDMENCVLGDERDIPDKMAALMADPGRLEEITGAGYSLVRERHLAEHRPQVSQWLELSRRLGPGERIVQENPFSDLRVAPADSGLGNTPLSNNPEDRLYLEQGRALLRRGDFRGASRLFGQALNLAWHMPEANLGMALADLLAGRPDSAFERLKITLKWCMKQYRSHQPNPVEWAWMIVVSLCRGRDVAALSMSRKYPDLRHEELERARAVVALLLDGAHGLEEKLLPSRPACIHAPVYEDALAWWGAAASMLDACGRSEMAASLRRALTAAR